MKLLIAYDGSSLADAALDDLHRAGLPADCEAVVLSAADVWLPNAPADLESTPGRLIASVQRAYAEARKEVEEARALAERAAARLREAFPAWRVTAEARADSPAWAIIGYAETWQPDMIVVGSRGRSGLSELLLGSVSHKALAYASCSVRVARPAARQEGDPLRLVVGVDGSEGAKDTVQAVAQREWPDGTEATIFAVLDASLLTALPLLSSFGAVPASGGDTPEESARQMAEAAAERLRAAGLKTEVSMQAGDPKRVLLEEARKLRADCIFVGAHGLRDAEKSLIGSVTAAIAARAHCTVEVVRSHARP